MIFYINLDRSSKYCLVVGLHIININGHYVYASNMKLVLAIILLTIAAENRIRGIMGEIRHSQLNAFTDEKIYTCGGPEFALVRIMANGNIWEVVKATYRVPNSSNYWHDHLP